MISSQMSPGPVCPQALGDQIVSVYQSVDSLCEPPHPAWKQWLTYMLPVSVRFPLERVTASDLAFEAISGLHPDVVLDHRSWLNDVISRVPSADFNRVQNSKSILGELLLALNQWRNALGTQDRGSILDQVVQQTARWSEIISDHYLDRLQRTEPCCILNDSLGKFIFTSCMDVSADWPLADRQRLAAVLFITVGTHPEGEHLSMLLAICTLLGLQHPTSSFDFGWGDEYPYAVFEVLLQLFPQAPALRLSQVDLDAKMASCVDLMEPEFMHTIDGLSIAYSLLQLRSRHDSAAVRQWIETVVERTPAKWICGGRQDECILDTIRGAAASTQDPSELEWLDQIQERCSDKLAARTWYHSKFCDLRRRIASSMAGPHENGRDVGAAPPDNTIDECHENRSSQQTSRIQSNPEHDTNERVDSAATSPSSMGGNVSDGPSVPVNQPASGSTKASQPSSSHRDIVIIIICCSTACVGIVAAVMFLWWKRRSYVVMSESTVV